MPTPIPLRLLARLLVAGASVVACNEASESTQTDQRQDNPGGAGGSTTGSGGTGGSSTGSGGTGGSSTGSGGTGGSPDVSCDALCQKASGCEGFDADVCAMNCPQLSQGCRACINEASSTCDTIATNPDSTTCLAECVGGAGGTGGTGGSAGSPCVLSCENNECFATCIVYCSDTSAPCVACVEEAKGVCSDLIKCEAVCDTGGTAGVGGTGAGGGRPFLVGGALSRAVVVACREWV
jgi:hypothetical protein